MACIKEGLFSVNVVKNEAHENAINEYLLATIKEAFMTSGNPLHKASFKKRMTAVKAISEDSSSSSSDSKPPDTSADDVSDADDEKKKKKNKIKKKLNPKEKQGEDDKEKQTRKKHDKEKKTPNGDKEKKQPKGDTEGKKSRKRVYLPEDEEDGFDILNVIDGDKVTKIGKTSS